MKHVEYWKHREDTWACVDMEYIWVFNSLPQGEYMNEWDKLNTRDIPYLQATMHYFVYYKDIMSVITTFFWFSQDFKDNFAKYYLKTTNITKQYFWIFLKIMDDCREFSRKINRCFAIRELRVKHDISKEIDIFTGEDKENTPPES